MVSWVMHGRSSRKLDCLPFLSWNTWVFPPCPHTSGSRRWRVCIPWCWCRCGSASRGICSHPYSKSYHIMLLKFLSNTATFEECPAPIQLANNLKSSRKARQIRFRITHKNLLSKGANVFFFCRLCPHKKPFEQGCQCILFYVVFAFSHPSQYGNGLVLPVISLLLTDTVSPVRACLSIWWERFRGSQEDDF